MDLALVITLGAWQALLALLGMLAIVWVGLLGVTACLFAVNLVLAQPMPTRHEVGLTSVHVAVLIALPIFVAGFSAVVWAWGA